MNDIDKNAYEAIRLTLATYNWCGDNGDAEGFVGTFAPDGVLEIKDRGTYPGRDAIRAAVLDGFGATPAQMERRRKVGGRFSHHVSSVRIEIQNPGEALVWAYFAVIGPNGLDHWGRYTDRLVPCEGRWLFAKRRVSIDSSAVDAVMYEPTPR